MVRSPSLALGSSLSKRSAPVRWGYRGRLEEKPRLLVLCAFVLCRALVYTALASLHRTNSPAAGLQQPVPSS